MRPASNPEVSSMRQLLLLVCLLVLIPAPATAQSPAVHAVLYYSPTCPHCHYVIQEVLPPLAETYGGQFLVLYVDVTQPEGQALYQSAIAAFNIPDDRLGVPTMIVGDHVMVGSGEIPAQLPGLIEAGLGAGGIDWPAVPGLEDAVVGLSPEATQTVAAPAPVGQAPNPAADPAGSSLAIGVLLALVASLGFAAWRWLRPAQSGPPPSAGNWPWLGVPLVIGLVAALYLALVEAMQAQAFCGPVGDCVAVQASQYATLLGLSVAWLGVAGYGLIALGWLLGFGGGVRGLLARVAVSVLTGFGSLVFVYLTYLEPFVIGAVCLWCLLSATSMAILLILSAGPGRSASLQLKRINR
jgi:uncharacterized membrane protein